MTEADARDWIINTFDVSRETLLVQYASLLREEASRQNLVSPTSLVSIWARHIVDSAQLVPLAANQAGTWVDIGSGAGLPGLVVAMLRDDPVILVEPRRKRVEFLEFCADRLKLRNVTVRATKVAAITDLATVISARAVASINQLFAGAVQCATADTLWILPRGIAGAEELAIARKTWQGSFHVKQSLTHPQSTIVTAKSVRPR